MDRLASSDELEAEVVGRCHRELEVLTASYLALQERCDLLRSELHQERSRRLHDLEALDAVRGASAVHEAAAAAAKARNDELESQVQELNSQVAVAHSQIGQMEDAIAAAAWSPHVLRLRTLWRRLPTWVRRPVHGLLSRAGNALDRRHDRP